MTGKANLNTLEVCDINLVNAKGTKSFPIKDQVLALSIFEDIFSSLVTCNVTINDSLALSHDMPFLGEEILNVSIKSTNASKPLKYQFLLYGMGDSSTDEQNKHTTYTLSGISIESVANARISVQKGYLCSYSDVVKDLVTSFLSSTKKVMSTPTRGVHQTIIPNIHPLKAIDFVRQKATSPTYPYSPFFFFETSQGFHFVDAVTLFSEAKKVDVSTITREFRQNYSEGSDTLSKEEAWRSIVEFHVDTKHDTMAKLQNGAFFNKMQKFDFITKQFTETDVKLADIKKNMDLVSEGAFNTQDMIDRMSQNGALNFFVVEDSSRPASHIDMLGQRLAYSTLLFQNIVNMELHADTTLEAGKVLFIDIQKPTGITEAVETDTKQSGYYMITKLAYHITIEEEPTCSVACQLVKGANKSIKEKL